VRSGETTILSDSFETNAGWTVQNDASLTSGAWERGVPVAMGGHGAPITDADGSGSCYVTGNTADADVDRGPTRLLSPVLNLSVAPEARVTYSRWLVSLVGTADSLVTEISGNNGGSWTPVSTVTPATGGWERVRFRVADYITPTAQVRVRFTVSDPGATSTTEAAIDAFSVTSPFCTACYANCDASTAPPTLNVADFTCYLQRFASGDGYANCDGSVAPPVLNVADFTCFLQKYAAGCP
jgi:hypothetical protein